jgi:hypothetical protein
MKEHLGAGRVAGEYECSWLMVCRADLVIDGTKVFELKPESYAQYVSPAQYRHALGQIQGYMAQHGFTAGTWADLELSRPTLNILIGGSHMPMSGMLASFGYDPSNASSGLLFYRLGSPVFMPGSRSPWDYWYLYAPKKDRK